NCRKLERTGSSQYRAEPELRGQCMSSQSDLEPLGVAVPVEPVSVNQTRRILRRRGDERLPVGHGVVAGSGVEGFGGSSSRMMCRAKKSGRTSAVRQNATRNGDE